MLKVKANMNRQFNNSVDWCIEYNMLSSLRSFSGTQYAYCEKRTPGERLKC